MATPVVLPFDIVTLIASFGRLSVWTRVARLDKKFAAACRMQRAWRAYRDRARFVLGALVRLRARAGTDADVAVQLVARRRTARGDLWTGKLVRSRVRHYVYVLREVLSRDA